MSTINCPGSQQIHYEYDAAGNLTHVYGDVVNERVYVYTTEKRLYAIKDASQRELAVMITRIGDVNPFIYINQFGNRFTYSKDGAAYCITDSNARVSRKSYNQYYDLTSSTDPLGGVTTIEFEGEADAATYYREEKKITDRYGNTTEYKRDASGNILQQINPDYSAKIYRYDRNHNVIYEADAAPQTNADGSIKRDSAGNILFTHYKKTFYVYADANGNTVYGENSRGVNRVIQAEPLNGTDEYAEGANEANFAITRYTYGTVSGVRGLLLSKTNPNQHTTTYTYDENGFVATVTDPLSHVTSRSYNLYGQETQVTTPGGAVTTNAYDAKNNPTTSSVAYTDATAPGVARTDTSSREYGSGSVNGQPTKIVAPNQYTGSAADVGSTYTYYSHGLVHTETDALGNTTTREYDGYGNMSREIRPNGAIYGYEYDALNRLTRKTFQANAAAAPQTLEEISYACLPYTAPKPVRTEDTKTTVKTYGGQGGVSTVVTSYDMLRRETRRVLPDGSNSLNVYNPNGTLHHQIDPRGYATYYAYDGLCRMTGKWTQIEGEAYSYEGKEYDKAGNVLKEKTGLDHVANGVTPSDSRCIIRQCSYYADERLKSEEVTNGRKTLYEYDADGNVSKQEEYYSATGKVTKEYINNYRGQPLRVTEYLRSQDLQSIANEVQALTTQNSYDKNGNLRISIDPMNVATTNTYDVQNRLLSTSTPGEDEFGRSAKFTRWYTYTYDGQIATETDFNGNLTANQYNEQGFLIRTQQTVSTEGKLKNLVTAYDVDLKGRVIRSVTPKNYLSNTELVNLNHTEYIYDSSDRLIVKNMLYRMPGATGFTEQVAAAYQYDASGNKIKELSGEGYAAGGGSPEQKIASGYGTEYTYNGANQVVTMRDAVTKERGEASTISYTYDGAGRTLTETNANGVTMHYTYDPNGNITHSEATVQNGETLTVYTVSNATYDRMGRKLTESDGEGRTTSYEYNDLSKLRRTVLPGDASIAANTIVYLYDRAGRLAQVGDSANRTETYTYDNQGREIARDISSADAPTTVSTATRYDKNGNVRFAFDANGMSTEYVYDAQNRKVEEKTVVSGKQKSTRYVYDDNGNLQKTIDWLGNVRENTLDPLGRIIAVSDPYATVQKFEYNKDSRQTKAYQLIGAPGSNSYALTTYAYDKNGRLTSTTKPHGTTSQTYDGVGNVITATDGNGNVTTYEYTYANLLAKVVNAKNETTRYTYDRAGNLLQQFDGENRVTETQYNIRNLPKKRIDGANLEETLTYDANGQMLTKTDRNGVTTSYTYDAQSRLISQSATKNDTAQSISYTYDGVGNMLSMTDSTGTTTRTYDEIGRVLTKTVPEFGTSTYQYDITTGVFGEYSERTIDPAGNVTERGYDKAGRLVTVRDAVDAQPTTYTYDGGGRKTSVTYPNGAQTTFTYDSSNRLTQLTNNGTSDVYTYTYDAAGNQTSKTETVANTARGTTTYQYDALNRLETVTEPGGKSTEYVYDAAGNRTSENVTEYSITTTTSYTYNAQNRMMSVTQNGATVSYAYDYNGNMISKGSGTYSYDALDRMVSADGATYTYNGEGKRVAKTIGNVTTRYLYEGDQVILEKDSGGNIIRNVHGANLISRSVVQKQSTTISEKHVMEIRYDNTAFYQYNGRGDVTRISDFNGNSEIYTYDAFGNQLSKTTNGEVGDNPFRYAGYMYDEESEYYYLNARYYDPKTARFLSEDAPGYGNLNDPLSLNLYTYCANSPLVYTDPSGHIYYSKDGIGPGWRVAIADKGKSGSSGLAGPGHSTTPTRQRDGVENMTSDELRQRISTPGLTSEEYTEAFVELKSRYVNADEYGIPSNTVYTDIYPNGRKNTQIVSSGNSQTGRIISSTTGTGKMFRRWEIAKPEITPSENSEYNAMLDDPSISENQKDWLLYKLNYMRYDEYALLQELKKNWAEYAKYNHYTAMSAIHAEAYNIRKKAYKRSGRTYEDKYNYTYKTGYSTKNVFGIDNNLLHTGKLMSTAISLSKKNSIVAVIGVKYIRVKNKNGPYSTEIKEIWGTFYNSDGTKKVATSITVKYYNKMEFNQSREIKTYTNTNGFILRANDIAYGVKHYEEMPATLQTGRTFFMDINYGGVMTLAADVTTLATDYTKYGTDN